MHLNGGFVSHVAGKVFVRTGIAGLEMRIHNAFLDGQINPGHQVLSSHELCHVHYKDFDDWRGHFTFRHALGSYRAELKPNVERLKGGLNTHELFATILESDGEAGLRRFFHDVCTATPALRARLGEYGLLREHVSAAQAARVRVFPDWVLASG